MNEGKQMEPGIRKIFGTKRKRFSLEAERANFDFREKNQENDDKTFITVSHGVYGRVFVYKLQIISIFALIFLNNL